VIDGLIELCLAATVLVAVGVICLWTTPTTGGDRE
jgi:hypothetical protein